MTRSSASELPLGKKLLFSVLATALFFGAVELALGVLGVEPALYDEDPYVGFSGAVPHFVATTLDDGSAVVETARNKLRLFHRQRFPRHKSEGTARVFCLGGSTTYGRPYGDATSFCGWLRELLPVADPSRRWQVINAGGISYASYRVALLTEELLQYQPDLFVVYTGHNEFLERRTYGGIIAAPRAVRGLGALASRTRIFTFARATLTGGPGPAVGTGQTAGTAEAAATLLDDEVRTLLDASVGPDDYHRDDDFRQRVLEHFRYSLARIVDIGRSAGAEVVLINPAANLRHCSPFKSESSPLAPEDADRWRDLFGRAEAARDAGDWERALVDVEAALELDERYAGAHFLRGQALDALGRLGEATAAYQRAREEDVCPLRAPGAVSEIVEATARQRDVPWVDFRTLVEARSRDGIPGGDLFLDHVHPTIEGHRLLALEIVETLAQESFLELSADWGEPAVEDVTRSVLGRIDPADHGLALSQLSRVLGWAGKLEEAYKLALRAVELAPDRAQVHHQAALCAHLTQRIDEAVAHYQHTLELDPRTVTAHGNLAVILDEAGRDGEAAIHYRHAISLLSDKNAAYRERLREALAKIDREAVR